MEGVVVKKKKGVQYFTQDTEDSIVLYNNTPDPEVRSRIYRDKIHYAFFKLTENIIHTFKFYYTEVDNIEDLQHEVITFLLSKIHLYDQSKGAKAYSYFGTIAKRYLILSNQKNYKKRIETIDVDVLDEDDLEEIISKLEGGDEEGGEEDSCQEGLKAGEEKSGSKAQEGNEEIICRIFCVAKSLRLPRGFFLGFQHDHIAVSGDQGVRREGLDAYMSRFESANLSPANHDQDGSV